ncbi:head-tail adaptor protein [Brevundimonas sp.]|uniref:phage head completion protein n=1 Tax=Brevundimonas sp. TaxID=1871086 RepID=UPI0025C66EA0|nr:head-tail adaptor protein [Brevundimonas sp.]
MAGLHRPVEAETPYGGRVVSYEPMGVVWLAPGARRRRERTEGGVTRGLETLAATTRTDERLEPGLVVRFGGADWRIEGVEPDPERAGRMRLALERTR